VSYEVDWLDEDLRIAAVRLYEPFYPEDGDGLREALLDLLDPPAPLYVLLDLTQFNAMKAFTELSSAFEGQPMPEVDQAALRGSYTAVTGGGMFISTLLALVNPKGSEPRARHFRYEDEALTWLRERAERGKVESEK
jgi:hypothetical protein